MYTARWWQHPITDQGVCAPPPHLASQLTQYTEQQLIYKVQLFVSHALRSSISIILWKAPILLYCTLRIRNVRRQSIKKPNFWNSEPARAGSKLAMVALCSGDFKLYSDASSITPCQLVIELDVFVLGFAVLNIKIYRKIYEAKPNQF